ncbi:hypothetical protein M8C21_022374 [Ambrosia artemisiifolia]|uniref:Uncharacterized protein n=1 Tax=Ambrosia artemisiifolia TaxID=4212 RepID=A0AAD5C673_AMBAR|nr:hypothetical protein M8C21_022374 [Ambrosia artemisiifolia]
MKLTMDELFEPPDEDGIRMLRIPEETKKYMREFKETQARFWRLPNVPKNKKLNAGDNQNKVSGQPLGLKKLHILGTYLGIQPVPKQPRNPLYQILEDKHRSKILQGKPQLNAAAAEDDHVPPTELSLGQRESEVEHDHAEDVTASTEEKQLATYGTKIPNDLLSDEVTSVQELKKVTDEDMEAYRINKDDHEDPMKDFLN